MNLLCFVSYFSYRDFEVSAWDEVFFSFPPFIKTHLFFFNPLPCSIAYSIILGYKNILWPRNILLHLCGYVNIYVTFKMPWLIGFRLSQILSAFLASLINLLQTLCNFLFIPASWPMKVTFKILSPLCNEDMFIFSMILFNHLKWFQCEALL